MMNQQDVWRVLMFKFKQPELSTKSPRLVSVKKLCQMPEYEWLSVAAMRHIIFQSESRFASNGEIIKGNGLKESGALIRFGRKILIDLNRFDKWILSHREN
jgi:hypothetical protein